jgi:hypothetical protein
LFGFINDLPFMIVALLLLLLLIFVGIFFYKKNYSLKFIIPSVIMFWLLISIIIMPRTDYEFLKDPNIPKDTKLLRIAKIEIEKLGYDSTKFEIITSEKKEVASVFFIPKESGKKSKMIRLKINESYEISSIDRWEVKKIGGALIKKSDL